MRSAGRVLPSLARWSVRGRQATRALQGGFKGLGRCDRTMRVQIVSRPRRPARRWHLAIASFALHSSFRPLVCNPQAGPAPAASGLVTLGSARPFHSSLSPAHQSCNQPNLNSLPQLDERNERGHPGALGPSIPRESADPSSRLFQAVPRSACCRPILCCCGRPGHRSRVPREMSHSERQRQDDGAVAVKWVFISLPGK